MFEHLALSWWRFWKVEESLGNGSSLEEVGYWEQAQGFLTCPKVPSTLCFLTEDEMQ